MQSFAVARPRCVCFPGRHEPDHFMLATMPERTRCVGSAMSYTTATVIVVLCTLLLLASRADALRSCGSTAGWLQVTEDCVLQPLTANADSNSYSVVGVLGAKGLPAVHADPEAAAATTPAAGVTHPGMRLAARHSLVALLAGLRTRMIHSKFISESCCGLQEAYIWCCSSWCS
jgi:hypothetical protein